MSTSSWRSQPPASGPPAPRMGTPTPSRRSRARACRPRAPGRSSLERRECLADRLVHVLAIVRFARRDEDRDLGQSGSAPATGLSVRAEGAERHPRGGLGARHLVRVGQLRNPLGADEAGDLDPRQTGPDEGVDETQLAPERDGRPLVLQAVAGRHLVESIPCPGYARARRPLLRFRRRRASSASATTA